jgi:gliding motility-associated-like protein
LNAAGETIRSYTGSNGDSIKDIATGNYSVKLKNNDGCDTTIIFSIKAPPAITFSAGKTNVCAGDTVHFTSVSSTEPINTYRWNFGDGTTSNERDPQKIFAVPGSFEVMQRAVGDNGCTSNQPSIKIMVASLPHVNAGPDQTMIAGSSVVLQGASNSTTPDVLWYPSGHLSANNILQPLATPPATQLFYLSVTTEQGCTAFDTMQVRILEKISVPNAFSPNNDGINDRWEIPGLNGYTSSQVSVFNRWGQQVFHSSGYNISWDGKYNGKPLPVGTYYYMIDLKNDRAAKPFQGAVTIIR